MTYKFIFPTIKSGKYFAVQNTNRKFTVENDSSFLNPTNMELVELQPLFDTYHRKLSKIDLRFKRYHEVDEGATSCMGKHAVFYEFFDVSQLITVCEHNSALL